MRVLIAGSQPMARQSLRRVLAQAFNGVTCAEAGTAQQASDLVQRVRWDLVLLDVALAVGGANGPLEGVRDVHPRLPVIVLAFREGANQALVDAVQSALADPNSVPAFDVTQK